MGGEIFTQEGTVERSGATLHYWTSGPNGGPLVVLTHGATLDHRMFDPQIGPLNAAGWRTLTWDMRGHGLSKPMGSTFSLPAAVDDLLAIADDVGVEAASFIGHSFGGYVAQALAYQHPERVRAVGVIGCTDLSAKPSAGMKIASRLMPYLLPLFSLEGFRKRTVAEVSSRADVTALAYEATGSLSKADDIEVIMAGVACLARGSGVPEGAVLGKPFLLTHGELDRANNGIFPRSAPAWAKKEPHCTYRCIGRMKCILPDAACRRALPDRAPASAGRQLDESRLVSGATSVGVTRMGAVGPLAEADRADRPH